MRWALRSLVVLVSMPLVAVGVLSGYVLFFWLSGQVAVYRALDAVSAGAAVPADIELDISPMSVEFQAPGAFAGLLKGGVRMDAGTWRSRVEDFPSPGWAFGLHATRKVGLFCETYPGRTWSVVCGQVVCDATPCTFRSPPSPTEAELREACRSVSRLGKLIVRALGYPVTLEEAAGDVMPWLDDGAREQLRATAPEDLIQYHFTLGQDIRNNLGLWTGNPELVCSACGGVPCHPDEASSRILAAVWRRLQ